MPEPNGEAISWAVVELNREGVEPKIDELVDPNRDGELPTNEEADVDPKAGID